MTQPPLAHADLPDTGRTTHFIIDEQLPSAREAQLLTTVAASVPLAVTGARDETEGALKALLTALATLGLITDSTTAS